MAITTQDQLIAAMNAGPRVQFFKAPVSGAVGGFSALFRVAGSPGSAGAAPGTAAGQTLSRTSVGALPILPPFNVTYCTSYEASLTVVSALTVSDRLVETATLSGTVTTAQTVGSVALPARATGANDVELWLEVYTALGGTASPTVTASYTNEAGTAGRTATLIGGLPASAAVHRTFQMTLQAGDLGVRTVESVTSTTSTGVAGNFGVTLRRNLLMGSAAANSTFFQGYAETDLQRIPDDACLELILLAGSSVGTTLIGALGIAQG